MDNGWIKLHRKIMENPYYFAEDFTKSQAWIDLLLLASFKDTHFYVRGVRVNQKRGQIGYSFSKLSERWGWSIGKVRRFIFELENDKQIVLQKSNVTTLISIQNYDKYQQDGIANKHANDTADGTQTVLQTDTIEECKESKESKRSSTHTRFKKPTLGEVVQYFYENDIPIEKAKEAFLYYDENNWRDGKGKEVKNWKGKMRTVWFKDRNGNKIKPTQSEPIPPYLKNRL